MEEDSFEVGAPQLPPPGLPGLFTFVTHQASTRTAALSDACLFQHRAPERSMQLTTLVDTNTGAAEERDNRCQL